MRPEFTEFSFGYAITDSISRSLGGFDIAPVFPNLFAEGQPAGGYDVAIQINGVPMLLQFKVPEVLTRHSRRRPEGFGLPYYRMHLHPYRHSEQHRLLLEHQQEGRQVFYVSPRFSTTAELNVHYLAGNVWFNSFIIAPRDIGDLPDDDDHCIAYGADGIGHQFQSESRPLTGRFDGYDAEERLKQAIPKDFTPEATKRQLFDLVESMIAMVGQRRLGKSIGLELDQIRRESPLRAAGYMSRVFFDCELFLVKRR